MFSETLGFPSLISREKFIFKLLLKCTAVSYFDILDILALPEDEANVFQYLVTTVFGTEVSGHRTAKL